MIVLDICYTYYTVTKCGSTLGAGYGGNHIGESRNTSQTSFFR